MKFIFEIKTTFFYILSAILLTTVLLIFYETNQKVIASNNVLVHSQQVINKSDEVLIDALNIETGFRGYLISGDEAFLEPFTDAKTKIYADLGQLQTLTKDNQSQLKIIDILKKAVDDRLVFTNTNIENRKRNQANDLARIDIVKGKIITDNIRRSIGTIKNEEFRVLAVQNLEYEKNNQFSGLLFLLLLVFLIAIFIFVILIISKEKDKNNQLETYTANQRTASQYALSLIEASLDPLVTISTTGKIMDMNQALVNITGVEREELVGSDFFDYFTDQQSAREVYQKVFEKGSVADSPLTIRHKDGKLTDVLFNGSVFRNDSGVIMGVVIVARDIAEQKWALDLQVANKELAYQNAEKEKRANELSIANEELAFQNAEKEKRANELSVANEELACQYEERENRAAELVIANEELAYQNQEKENRANELVIADIELNYQNQEKEKREIVNKELEELSYSAKLASQYTLSLIEASRDPLVTISTEGKITDMNQATVSIIGMKREELIGSNFFDYFTDQQMAREVYQEVFEKGSVADAPLTLRNSNGKLTDVLFNGSVYKDGSGNVLGVVIVARDVTDQKRIATELIEARIFAELATAIAEEEKRNAETATAIAENAVKSKQQFLSNMSHEIRTPMNAIIGFTKVVLKTELTVKQKEYLSAIKLSGDALIVLINDILDLAKVDAGKMTFEKVPFQLDTSVSAMLHVFETKIREKKLQLASEFDYNIPKILLGDPVRLHQIILNLVSNAIKFTSTGHITVSVRLLEDDEESSTVEFAVADTGIGIEESKVDTIFDNFQQATSGTARLYGGTGLGLAIVKQLVEAQGGTVSVKSKIDEGSIFSFTLRFEKTNLGSELEAEAVELENKIQNIKVMVVEDMPLNQFLMKTLLDDFGFEYYMAENGKKAIETLQKESFDIILMDLQMPVMNGFEATKYIRNTLNLQIPIIALTADVTTVDLAKCKVVGMNDYIAKPVDERILYSKIVGLVKKPLLPRDNSKVKVVPEKEKSESSTVQHTNLDYLKVRTKSNSKLMMEMVSIYLQQTPPLINAMKQSVLDKDWTLLASATHKIIPSFGIMGMSPDLEVLAKQVQEDAKAGKFTDETAKMVVQLVTVCTQACTELELEFNLLKNT